jgi:hypothetical protein
MTVNIQRNDATRSAVPGFPVKIALEGNVGGGVGPGMVKILRVVANPAGPDLAGEFVEIINPSDATVDLAGCTVGDLRGRGGPRRLHSFDSSFTLDPVSSTGPRRLLRIFTGPGVPTDPAFVQIPLNRGAPVWNNAGDTAWIRNSLGQTVDTFVYPAGANPAQFTPGPSPVTATVVVPPTSVLAPGAVPAGALVPTPISVEEGDRLVFSAAGEIWVGYGLGSGRSGPEGKGTDGAGDGYPAPGAPPISLIGTIGSTGQFFLIGSATTHFVDNAEGPLFLAVNDAKPEDNWGAGYTCVITRFRP